MHGHLDNTSEHALVYKCYNETQKLVYKGLIIVYSSQVVYASVGISERKCTV